MPTSDQPGQRLVPFHLKIDPSRIVDLKFTIESYEGLGIVRTLNPDTGVIVVLALESTAPDVTAVINDLRSQFEILDLPLPDSYGDDWLLSEHFNDHKS